MKDLPKAFEAKEYEANLYSLWEQSGAFAPDLSKEESYSIMLPPPNATGTLHLGHATMLALQDILIRWKRMEGNATLWLPGTDHAAIATQSVVEKKLQANGIKHPRQELGREGLLTEIRRFVEESKDTIRNQMRKMGASVDWSRERYTFSEDMNHAVNTLFKMMYDDGLIYRGDRIVNWDPKMQTTVADDELEYEEERTPFYYFKFGPVVIGTARPETKFADKVIVVHPDDDRYKDLIGKTFTVEWIEGPIEATVIADECMDMNLGTGAMTITPAHSMVDFEIAQKHNLERPQIIDLYGKIRPEWSKTCGGLSTKEARKKVLEILTEKGLVDHIDENYVHNIAVNYRGKGVVEPQILKQWFVDVNKPIIEWKTKKLSIKEVLQDVVHSQMIRIVPDRFEKTYFHWIDNLRDWCISRQIWWGHRIPVWYKGNEIRVGEESPGADWIQDEDTLDTWFSSGLWTFSTLGKEGKGWPELDDELKRFMPSSVLETGYDILFFWVARMILMSTYALRKIGFDEAKSIPFKDVYLHGLIRDIRGKKMSKSHPETCIDPLDMIEKYGTDAIRLSLVIGSTPGNDMRLYEEKIAGYRNFVNKIWNGARFVLMNLDEKVNSSCAAAGVIDPSTFTRADKWILHRLRDTAIAVSTHLRDYRFSEAALAIYDFFWGEYCDWYLEMSKVNKNVPVLKHVLETSLVLLHPFMPFVTEAIWQTWGEKTLLMTHRWPTLNDLPWEFPLEKIQMNKIHEMVRLIRAARAELKVDPVKKIHVIVYAHEDFEWVEENADIIRRLAGIEQFDLSREGGKINNAASLFVDHIEIYLPFKDLIDIKAEKTRLQKEKETLEVYVKSLENKFENEAFVKNAPKAILEQEKLKFEEARVKLEKIEKRLEEI